MKTIEILLAGFAIAAARVCLTVRALRVNLETRRFLAKRGRRVIEEV